MHRQVADQNTLLVSIQLCHFTEYLTKVTDMPPYPVNTVCTRGATDNFSSWAHQIP